MKNYSSYLALNVRRKNTSCDEDFNFEIRSDRWLLATVGLWPEKSRTKFEACRSILLMSYAAFWFFFSLLTNCIDFYELEIDLKEMTIIIGSSVYFVLSNVKFYTILFRKKFIRDFFRMIFTDWAMAETPEQREIMLAFARRSRFIVFTFALVSYASAFSYTLVIPFITDHYIVIGNDSTLGKTRHMPYFGLHFFRDIMQNSPYYEIIYLFYIYNTYIQSSMLSGVYNLFVKLTMHACGQCKLVMAQMDHLFDNSNAKDFDLTLRNKLGHIVEHHIEVLR